MPASRQSERVAPFVVLAATVVVAFTEFLAFGAFSSTNATTLTPDARGLIAWSDPAGQQLATGYLPYAAADFASKHWSGWWAWEKTIMAWSAIACIAVSVMVCAWCSMKDGRPVLNVLALLVITIVAANPFVTIWSVGEHSTPYLMMFSALLAAQATLRSGGNDMIDDVILIVLALAAFLIRLDSVVFLGPVLIHWFIGSGNRVRSGAIMAIGAACAIAWIALSPRLHNEVAPAIATMTIPDISVIQCLQNILYVGSFALLSGVGLLLIPAAATGSPLRKILALSWLMNGGVWTGLAFTAVYVVLTSPREMMFAFGALVPYLPVVAILLVRAIPLAAKDETRANSMVVPIAAVLTQTALSVVVYLLMVNPPGSRYWTPPRPQYGAGLETEAERLGQGAAFVAMGEDRSPRTAFASPEATTSTNQREGMEKQDGSVLHRL